MGGALEDYQWLVGPAAQPWLEAAEQWEGQPLKQVDRLRRELSPSRAALVTETVQLRHQATEKFSRAGQMYFTRNGLQQATDESIATYKAARFPDEELIADLCSGIGGDAVALCRLGCVEAIDRSPVMAVLAFANAAAYGVASRLRAVTADVTSRSPTARWLHIDPDRRATGRRVARDLQQYQPDLVQMERLLRGSEGGCVKLAPAAHLPEAWQRQAECEWLTRGGECRQLVVWCGALARQPGGRRATLVTSQGVCGGSFAVAGHVAERPATAEEVSAYLFEPDPSVLAADLTDVLAQQLELRRLAPRIAYLTGPQLHKHPLLTPFRVESVLPFDERRLRSYLRDRNIGRLEVKKRGVAADPHRLARRLAASGPEGATLLISPGPRGIVAIIAQRVRSD